MSDTRHRGEPPAQAWEDDFPISWVDDRFVTRREFTQSLMWASCAAFAATAAVAGIASRPRPAALPHLPIAERDELAVGASKAFDYPHPGEPCLLLRPAHDVFVAFSQRCTHLGCPVVYEAQAARLHCPCHEGFFAATDGRVVAGPPPRPLPRVALEWRGRELWAVGMLA